LLFSSTQIRTSASICESSVSVRTPSIAFALGTDIDEEVISPVDDGRSKKKASSLIMIKLDGIDCRYADVLRNGDESRPPLLPFDPRFKNARPPRI
jgi:hypothetical protein